MAEALDRIMAVTRQQWECEMDNRLMNEQELARVTGYKRASAQVRWFERTYGFRPVQNGEHGIVITWETFHELDKRRAGVGTTAAARPALRLA